MDRDRLYLTKVCCKVCAAHEEILANHPYLKDPILEAGK